MEEKSVKIGDNRREDGTFGPGNIANPNGRPKLTEEEKLMKKAVNKYIEELLQGLAESLPEILPIHIAKAKTGDMVAIKEIYDRVMGKPRTPIDAEVKITSATEFLDED